MSSIRSILKKYGREVYLYTNSANQKESLEKSLDQALKEIEELIDRAIMPAISVNQKGQFEDDGGNICWYLDDLEKALRNNLKELLK